MRALAATVSRDEQEAWLKANAVDCQRYKSRISPGVCERYRLVDPVNCKGCARLDPQAIEDLKQMAALPGWARCMTVKAKVGRVHTVTRPAKKQNRKGTCVECGLLKTIIGRGRCGCCYQKDRKRDEMVASTTERPAESSQTVQRYPLSAVTEEPGEVKANELRVVRVPLSFVGDDLKIYEEVQRLAGKDRRSVENEILCILESYLEEHHAGE